MNTTTDDAVTPCPVGAEYPGLDQAEEAVAKALEDKLLAVEAVEAAAVSYQEALTAEATDRARPGAAVRAKTALTEAQAKLDVATRRVQIAEAALETANTEAALATAHNVAARLDGLKGEVEGIGEQITQHCGALVELVAELERANSEGKRLASEHNKHAGRAGIAAVKFSAYHVRLGGATIHALTPLVDPRRIGFGLRWAKGAPAELST